MAQPGDGDYIPQNEVAVDPIKLARDAITEARKKVHWRWSTITGDKCLADLDTALAALDAIPQPAPMPGDAEPVAVRHSFDGYGWLYDDSGNGSGWVKRSMGRPNAEPLYDADALSSLRTRLAEVEGAQTNAARDVLAERARQISAEDWTTENDDAYHSGDLANAAACYAATNPAMSTDRNAPWLWPWAASWWKPTNRRRDLVKAGALILAEIERLDRATLLKLKEPCHD